MTPDLLDEARASIAQLRVSLAHLDAATLEPSALAPEQPIFVAGLGWRTGSTLLQRILMSDPSCLVWGEPIDAKMIVGRLVEALSNPNPPPEFWISARRPPDLARGWVTQLWPDPGDLRAGLRALFDTWFAAAANRRGFTHWGVKEVRWSGADLVLLRWLYPDCRAVLIVRDPVEAYRSLVRYGLKIAGYGFWARWPDRPVTDAETYSAFWNEMASSWLAADEPHERVSYEDLVASRVDLADLGRRLGLALAPEPALERRVNAGPVRGETATESELEQVRRLTTPIARLLDYG